LENQKQKSQVKRRGNEKKKKINEEINKKEKPHINWEKLGCRREVVARKEADCEQERENMFKIEHSEMKKTYVRSVFMEYSLLV